MKRFFMLASLVSFSALFAQKQYTIQKGDTAYGISKKFGMSLTDLYKLNPNIKDGTLNVGDNILVKGKENTGNQNTTTSSKTGKIILQPKQTLYGLTKQYHITEVEIRKLNPNLEMKIGEEVILPQEKIDKYADANALKINEENVDKNTASEPVKSKIKAQNSDGDFITHTVQSGDTVFGIINKYGITLNELLELNPQVSNGLQSGMVLKIKKADPQFTKKTNDALNVVLMMPFGFGDNDTKYRSMAADFLSGARLAMERNAHNGLKMNINIVDSGSEKSFKNSLSQINQDNTDLIIGPFFKSNIIEVMDFLGNKKIPVVAPFANAEELYAYSNLIIMETADNIYSDRIAKEVVQSYNNEKIYIVSGENKNVANLLKTNIQKSLKKAEIIIVNSSEEIALDKNMMTGKVAPVVTILATNDDNEGLAFSNKIIALTKETTGIKAFSLYSHASFEKTVDALSQANLVYLIDRKINTAGDFEKEILKSYKDKYCKTPNKYAIIGFDVVNDVLSRENTKGEILKNMGKIQTQLASKFEFVRAKSGGAFVNTGYRVVRLLPQ